MWPGADRSLYYDKDGKPIELMRWAALHDDRAYQVIRQTTVADMWWISTVWMGLDHSFGEGPPIIFETAVFWAKARDSEDELLIDLARMKYATLAEARRGHAAFVREYRNRARQLRNAFASLKTQRPA